MEEVSSAAALIISEFNQIHSRLEPIKNNPAFAGNNLLASAEAVIDNATAVVNQRDFSEQRLNSLVGWLVGFNRHLSDVEQTIYEEMGSDTLDSVQTHLKNTEPSYTTIRKYIKTL